jgi:hypothetical protein
MLVTNVVPLLIHYAKFYDLTWTRNPNLQIQNPKILVKIEEKVVVYHTEM